MKTLPFICWIICIFLILAGGQAHADDTCRVEWQATLPITFNNYIPTVPVSINDQTVNIGIDTGATTTLITPEAVAQLHLTEDVASVHKIQGSAGGAFLVHSVHPHYLTFAGMEYKMTNIPIAALKNQPGPNSIRKFGPAIPMVGLIGDDILSNYDVDYDIPNRTLTLYSVRNCSSIVPPWEGAITKVPFTIDSKSKKIIFPVTLDDHELNAIFDTGSGGSIDLFSSSAARVYKSYVPKQGIEFTHGGIGGLTESGYKYQINSFTIGREKFHGIIGVIDLSYKKADMLVGEGYMRLNNHRFWISYATNTLFIQSGVQMRPQQAGPAVIKKTSADADVADIEAEDFYAAKSAAMGGDAHAQDVLGSFYEHGKGVAQSYEQAAKWYDIAAKQGYPTAQASYEAVKNELGAANGGNVKTEGATK